MRSSMAGVFYVTSWVMAVVAVVVVVRDVALALDFAIAGGVALILAEVYAP
jgi:hypothetical protein